MALITNRVRQRIADGEIVTGAYTTIPAPAVVEIAALAGLDFVRLDPYHVPYNSETIENMVRSAYAHGITPWARVRNDPWTIMMILDTGVQAITIPNVASPDAARAAVQAAFYPPFGERESGRPLRFRSMATTEYLEWAHENILVSCQLEGAEGIENCKEIVRIGGVDVIQSGRSDLALALGVPGELDHPLVNEAEERIVGSALEAGKQVSILHSSTETGMKRTNYWLKQGVRIVTLTSDYQLLMTGFRNDSDQVHAQL